MAQLATTVAGLLNKYTLVIPSPHSKQKHKKCYFDIYTLQYIMFTLPVLTLSPLFRSTIAIVSPFSRESLAFEGKQCSHSQQIFGATQMLGDHGHFVRHSSVPQWTSWYRLLTYCIQETT